MSEDDLTGMIRGGDYDTSVMAAQDVVPTRTQLQLRVFEAFKTHGAMTDGELESLPEFEKLAYSTARKRRTELYQKGLLVAVGKRTTLNLKTMRKRTMTLWGISREHT